MSSATMNDVQQITDLFESLGILNRSENGLSLKEELPPLCLELDYNNFIIEWSEVPGNDSTEKMLYVIEFLKGIENIDSVGEAYDAGKIWQTDTPAWLKAA